MRETITDDIQGRLDELIVESNSETGNTEIQLYYAVTSEELESNLEQLAPAIDKKEVSDDDAQRVDVILKGDTIIFYFTCS